MSYLIDPDEIAERESMERYHLLKMKAEELGLEGNLKVARYILALEFTVQRLQAKVDKLLRELSRGRKMPTKKIWIRQVQSEHFTEADIKEMVKKAQAQGMVVLDERLIEIYVESLLLIAETAWEAGYEAKIEGRK